MSFKQTREARQNTQFFEAPSQEGQAASTIDRKMVWVLAAACALGAANLYYIQPLLADIARSFAVSEAAAGLIATLSQAGFALGLLLLVPLGDAFERRLLVPLALVGVTIALIATALAPTIALLALASFVVGVTTVVPQIIVPLGASLAAPQERGRVVGTIMSGLLIGVLLARCLSVRCSPSSSSGCWADGCGGL